MLSAVGRKDPSVAVCITTSLKKALAEDTVVV